MKLHIPDIPETVKQNIYRYSFAILATVVALMISEPLSPYMKQSQFLLYVVPVMLTSLWCGFWPALLTTILAILCVDYFAIEPIYSMIKFSGASGKRRGIWVKF
jgi:K+-sensing histidine kinase KdpD